MAKSNGKMAAGISTSKPSAASWLVLDRLPRVVRRAIHEAPVAINPESAAALLDNYGYSPEAAAEALQDACRTELMAFSDDYHRLHGRVLPHVAAGIKWQGYTSQPNGCTGSGTPSR